MSLSCRPSGEAFSVSKILKTLETTPTGADFDSRARIIVKLPLVTTSAVALVVGCSHPADFLSTRRFQYSKYKSFMLNYTDSPDICSRAFGSIVGLSDLALAVERTT